jgi:hypothetical protein
VPVHRRVRRWSVSRQVSLLLKGQLIFSARFETGVSEMPCPVLSLAQGTHRLCFMWDDSTHVPRSHVMFPNHSVNNEVTKVKWHKLKHAHWLLSETNTFSLPCWKKRREAGINYSAWLQMRIVISKQK